MKEIQESSGILFSVLWNFMLCVQTLSGQDQGLEFLYIVDGLICCRYVGHVEFLFCAIFC